MDAFKFDPQTNIAASSTVTSNTITVAGLSGPSVVSVGNVAGTADGASNPSTTPIAPAVSNTSPYVITGPEYNSSNAKWELLNGNSSSPWYSDDVSAQPNRLIELVIDFITPKLINKYRMFGVSNSLWTPISWKLWGSDDGSVWTELHSVTDYNSGAGLGSVWTSYLTFSAKAYRYMKLSTDKHGTSGVSIGELELIEGSGVGPSLATSLTVNGSGAGQSSPINNGDTVSVTCDTPPENGKTTFVPVTFSGVKDSVFAFTTVKSAASQGQLPEYADLLPFEYTEAYTPSAPNNELFVVEVGSSTQSSISFVDVITPNPSTIDDGKDYIFAADYFGNKLQRIDVDSGVVVHTISVVRPFAVGFTPTESPSATDVAHTLVACPDNDVVYIYDGAQHTQMYSVATGSKPVAVAGAVTDTVGDFSFWVACHDDNTVEYYSKIGAAAPALQKTYTLPASSGPAFVVVDSNNDCWVSLLGTNQLAKCASASTTVTTVNVTSDPWDMGLSDTYVYVALPAENKIAAIEIASSTVSYIDVGADPSHVEVIGANMWVLSFNTGVLTKYPMLTSTTVDTGVPFTGHRMGTGLTNNRDQTKVYALNMNQDAPVRYGFLERDPASFDLIDQVDRPTNVEIVSDEITIAGLGETSTMTVPNLYGLVIVKNGVDSGTFTSISNSDTIRLKVTTSPNNLTSYSIPVMFDDTFEVWEISTVETTIVHRLSGWMGGG